MLRGKSVPAIFVVLKPSLSSACRCENASKTKLSACFLRKSNDVPRSCRTNARIFRAEPEKSTVPRRFPARPSGRFSAKLGRNACFPEFSAQIPIKLKKTVLMAVSRTIFLAEPRKPAVFGSLLSAKTGLVAVLWKIVRSFSAKTAILSFVTPLRSAFLRKTAIFARKPQSVR